MKRLFAVVLAVLMLTLCACGAPAGNGGSKETGGGSDPQGGSSGMMGVVSEVDTESPVLVLTVTINPEFELTLNVTNTILSAKPLNADAEKLLAELDVTGQTYSTGIQEILAEAKEQSFLKDGGTVSITAEAKTGGVWTSATETILKKPIEAFQTQNALNISCNLTATGKTKDNGGLTEQVMEQDDGIVNTYYFNANNELVKAYSVAPDGTFAEVYFLGQGEQIQTTYYPDGSMDYSHMKDGIMTGYRITADGRREEFSFDISGSGTPQNTTVQNEDGSTTTATYYDNGELATVNTTWPNGDYENQTYHENGTLSSSVSQRDGIYSELTYGPDGALQKSYNKVSNPGKGNPIESIFYYGSNGEATKGRFTYGGGNYMEETYGEDQNHVVFRIQSFDGYYVETTVHADGSFTDRYRNADGTSGTKRWDSEGNLIEDIPDQ